MDETRPEGTTISAVSKPEKGFPVKKVGEIGYARSENICRGCADLIRADSKVQRWTDGLLTHPECVNIGVRFIGGRATQDPRYAQNPAADVPTAGFWKAMKLMRRRRP